MIKLERIYHDGVSWNFSDYFDYIKEVADEMPPSLRVFASTVKSYSLRGNRTLHDARVLSLVVSKRYETQFSDGKTSIEVSLVDQWFEGKIILRYEGVSSFLFSEPDLAGKGHADVLLHEFSVVRPGIYKHQIVMDHGGELHIEFVDFFHEWTELDS